MPIYAYKCAECSHELDVIRKVSDPPLTECPNCGKPALVKQITAAGFHLKGAGWYVTDFRDAGSGKKKDAGKPDEKAKTDQVADSNAEAKADTKADTKADGAADSKGAAKTEAKTESKSEPASKSLPVPTPPKTGSSGPS
jgi:putative FmdB family regulatory protein